MATSTSPPHDPAFPWHHLPHIFPTTQLPQRFASRPHSKPKAPPHPRAHKEALEGEHLRTLRAVDEKCPLYELVQYKCDVELGQDGEGKIKCRPVVRLFRKCMTVMVEVTELEKYQGYT
ncbi:hypothetical protein L211DRAFT_837847 [Terfezia boudieri ATCC MYA-4762]|uniref:Uncharacterized protein n=1 Tax=Terfezia boudieri ATCC MYA-4762 TaxID=1051890 RepID=A0A3N4LKA6_9PEZI|nr:hypothetical protein L211DRAFT_840037 [Terfezia boudieri ATCC MYA-4762]RPB23980.1 hypothetical protein L211DRAFT_837847 [Terfezia boudieri ATCC MYA-4762]